MKQIWAPWRLEYIHSEKPDECIFCAAGSKDPRQAHVLFAGSVSVVMLNKYPYNGGHLLIAPARHVSKLEEVTPEESIDVFRLMRNATAALTKVMKPDGFNVGFNLGKAAGAGIDDHLHIHIVPRWNGDSNFMPVLADVKIIPEHLLQTYDKLKPFFERLELD
ncbi:MAG: HIT domain-containing protein [Deltaproteobacteria bacterium]|nr:HIT domain-containing protein [Deltaproteobacteria bacterium]